MGVCKNQDIVNCNHNITTVRFGFCNLSNGRFMHNNYLELLPLRSKKYISKSNSYLSSVLNKLMPLRFELSPRGHVHFPVLVVLSARVLSLGHLTQD